MGQVQPHVPVKLIMGLLYRSDFDTASLCRTLHTSYGPIDFQSERLSFDYTDYYIQEMGEPLQRQFVSFESLIAPERLVGVKHHTNHLEQRCVSADGHRRVNIDPGYVSLAKLILASTKDHAHRIWLGEGIYAELTLRYHRGSFRPWEWTYPDYRTDVYIDILNHIRTIYLKQLRQR